LLIEQYDDRYKVLNEYKRELKSWSRLKPNDSLNLRKLYTFVMMFKTTVLRGDDDINTEIIELIHSKLPTYIQDRWNRADLKIRKSQKRKPSLHDFLELLQEEISLATDTLYSRQATESICHPKDTLSTRKHPITQAPKSVILMFVDIWMSV